MKTSRQANSVYRNQNAFIRAVFERAGVLRKVLCVALDYAKRKHLALICDGCGDILKAAFPVENWMAIARMPRFHATAWVSKPTTPVAPDPTCRWMLKLRNSDHGSKILPSSPPSTPRLSPKSTPAHDSYVGHR